MRNLIFFLSTFYSLILFSQNTNSDYNPNPINTVADFVNEPYNARGVGIGNTGSATPADINSMFWNPAKYVFINEDQTEKLVDYPKDMGFSLAYNRGYYTYLDGSLDFNFNAYKVIGKQTIAATFTLLRWGNIYLTDVEGSIIGEINPLEFSIDVAYSRKLSRVFSIGAALRYIHSDQFRKFYIQGIQTKVGKSVALDLALLYRKKLKLKYYDNSLLSFGLNISNIGNKINYLDVDSDYLSDNQKYFIPTNLRLGGSFLIEKDKHSYTFSVDLNKLLVPTSPIYYRDSADSDGNPVIYKGKDPHVNVFKGMVQSFYDAPNGFKEEMQEIYYGIGFEYWYNKLIAFRMGYFHEHKNKGNRKNINLGTGFRYKFITLDIAYSIIPDKPRDEEGLLTWQRNNWYINLIFQINTIKKPDIENE